MHVHIHNLNKKIRGVIEGMERMKICHKISGRRTRLGGDNRKKVVKNLTSSGTKRATNK